MRTFSAITKNYIHYRGGVRDVPLVIFALIFSWIFVLCNNSWMDVNNYWSNIDNLFSGHLIPYKDYTFEYPPLALIVFLIPRLFSWNVDSFHFAYGIFSSLFFIISIFYAYRIADYFRCPRRLVTLLYIVTALCMLQFLITRYDVFPAALIIIAISKYLDGKTDLAFFILSVAAMVKLYPVLIILGFLIPIVAKHDWTRTVRAVVICFAVLLVSELPFLVLDASSAFDYLVYHTQRGIQVESVIGSLIEMYHFLDPASCWVSTNYGSDNLFGPLPDMVLPFVTPAMLFAFVVFSVWAVIKSSKVNSDAVSSNHLSILFSAALVLIFIVFNKVYSAQYCIWIILILVVCFSGSIRKRNNINLLAVSLVLALLSFIAAYYYWLEGPTLSSVFPVLELLKNIATVAVMIVILLLIRSEVRPPDETE